jgi:probable H4MPT-linked C1 transfer pathway protein
LGLDIGGANLKAAHSCGTARLAPFPLWKNPAGLADALRHCVTQLPRFELLAVTMTGELCDCFATKREGVSAILAAVASVADHRPIRVWQTQERFVDMATAISNPLRTASANWLALARFAGRYAPLGTSVLIDIGSTTTDIVPLEAGKPVPAGRTDLERLRSHELVYTGVRRTPVCALLGSEGAAELFATMLDVYLLLGRLVDNDADFDTADGRPATRAAAGARLARMLCADAENLTECETRDLAEKIARLQLDLLRRAAAKVAQMLSTPPSTVVVSGSGEFLGRDLVNADTVLRAAECVSLADKLGPETSQAACAYAVAVFAAEAEAGPNG